MSAVLTGERMAGKKSDRALYETRAEEILTPIAEENGVWVYDVEYVREGDEYFLNIYIEKDGGVNIGDCENVSRALSDALDEADFITDPYTLIVSSPGLGRALTKDRHLQNSIGEEVEIGTYKPLPEIGQKNFDGVLKAFDKDTITVECIPPAKPAGGKKKKGKAAASQPAPEAQGPIELKIERKQISSIRLALDF